MYDPITADLIRGVPPTFTGLDLDSLPERLTHAFTQLAALRLEIGAAGRHQNELGLPHRLSELRRLAAALEAHAILLPRHETAQSAAFVAGTAHRLLYLAAGVGQYPHRSRSSLLRHSISPDVSATLLFLIAGYPSDAAEMADQIEIETNTASTVTASLLDAVARLGTGKLAGALENDLPQRPGQVDGLEAIATQILWFRLLKGVRGLLALLLGRRPEEYGGASEPLRVFADVQVESVTILPSVEHVAWPRDVQVGPVFSTFPGPHHLASLLHAAGRDLLDRSLVQVPSPQPENPRNWPTFLRRVASRAPYLWTNHKQAVESGYLVPGCSAVISLPTGAGKSLLATLKIASTLETARTVLYLAPTHALIGQTVRDLHEAFPETEIRESVIPEGYYAEIEAIELPDIAVMTPERCLLLLDLHPEAFERIGLIVLDECHILHSAPDLSSQRSLDAMMCFLGLLGISPATDVVLISAMLSNAEELADWLSSALSRPCFTIDLEWKPTRQARGCIVYDNERIQDLQSRILAERTRGETRHPSASLKRSLTALPNGLFCLRQTWNSRETQDYALMQLLAENVELTASPYWKLTPNKNVVAAALATSFASRHLKTLVFCQNRSGAASVAKRVAECLNSTSIHLDPQEQELLRTAQDEMGEAAHVFEPYDNSSAVHHGLLLASERRLAESVFSRPGGIPVLVATATLAQGMNLPAEVVIIAGDERFDTEAGVTTFLEAHELLNAAGRAGRAGHFAHGIVLLIPGRVTPFEFSPSSINATVNQLERILSQSDQCLHLLDPIEIALDAIQLAGYSQTPAMLSFLRRLPIDREQDSETRAFLGRSLAAYHAQQSQSRTYFDQQVGHAIEARRRLLLDPDKASWLDNVSRASGISPDILQELYSALLPQGPEATFSVADWIRWASRWLREDESRVGRVVRPGLLEAFFEPELKAGDGHLAGSHIDLLQEMLLKWTNGRPLREIELLLGTPEARLGKCIRARKFVLRVIPELSFFVGLIGQTWRAYQSAEGIDAPLPLSVATLGGCIREGFDSPEKLAIQLEDSSYLTRRAVHRVHERLREAIRSGDPLEEFSETRARIKVAQMTSL